MNRCQKRNLLSSDSSFDSDKNVSSVVEQKIKVFALGGLDENGKNLYVVEVNDKIFVLDAGLKYPTEDLLGVDAVIPDFTYLKENVSRVQGIFLSHGHEDHIGALPQLLSLINVPIYGTRLTMALVEDSLSENGLDFKNYKLYKIRENNELFFGDIKVTFFKTTHSIPDSVAICIHTTDGVIVYTSDFTFDQSAKGRYQTNYARISEISKEGVLCLLSESINAEKSGHTSTGSSLTYELEEAFSRAEGRIICSLYSSDLHRIQLVIDLAIQNGRKIAIIGRKMQRIVDISVKLGYLRIPKSALMNLLYIDEKNDNNLSNLVVLATGNRYEPFNALIRMAKHQDRLIHIEKSDTVIVATAPIPGNEIKAARTLDLLYRTGASVVAINKNLLPSSHASSEDLKLMMNLLKPQYIMPVIGEYRNLVAHAKIAEKMGYNTENVILLDNGDVVEFQQGELVNHTEHIQIDQVLVDGLGVGDIGSVVLRDRQLMANDGIIVVIANLNKNTKEIVAGPQIVSKGFVYEKGNEELYAALDELVRNIIGQFVTEQYVNWQGLRQELRDKIGKLLFNKTKRKPIIIPIVEEFNL
ncbi:ribonuclease J [Turicibacter sanguinis]|uniref:ribonuclease J n=1 Tax=Turicibacter sanguinis TaxID=154288 RepID=UPI0018ABB650|nr:ribonuclease J [Turicibacter sanguinis]MDB8553474.1 ribonuclease J [Turicibacter sanguinis]